jgi:hypothetical protein
LVSLAAGLLAALGLLAGLFCEVELVVCAAFVVLLVFVVGGVLDAVLAVVADGGRSVFAAVLAFGGRLPLLGELVWTAAAS